MKDTLALEAIVLCAVLCSLWCASQRFRTTGLWQAKQGSTHSNCLLPPWLKKGFSVLWRPCLPAAQQTAVNVCSEFWLPHVQARHRVMGTLAADEGIRVSWASHAAADFFSFWWWETASQQCLGCCLSQGLPSSVSIAVKLRCRFLHSCITYHPSPSGTFGKPRPPSQFCSLISLGCLPILSDAFWHGQIDAGNRRTVV